MKTYKYRLYPNRTQEKKLVQTLEVCKNLYNKCLEERISLYKNESKSIRAYEQIGKSGTYEVPDFKEVHSQVIQDVILKLDNSFQNFFRRVKTGGKPGFPRFKSSERFNSFTFPQSGFRLCDDSHLKLSKIGIVKIKLHRKFEGKVKRLTVKRDSCGHWFSCFVVDEIKTAIKTEVKTSVGIDLGCSTFAVLSNGTRVEHPHYYRESESKLAKIQSNYSKIKTRPYDDKRKIKVRKQLGKIHEKIKNQRNDFIHKLSTTLVREFDLICIEDLNIKGMTEDNYRNLNKSILDSGWSQFVSNIVYKAENAGKHCQKVCPAYTSQICSSCGTLVPKELHDRIHRCGCGLEICRDLNASLNILSFGTKLFSESC
jgi:putative transposase